MLAWGEALLATDCDRVGSVEALELSEDLTDPDCPPEPPRLGRTLRRWHHQIINCHEAPVTNGPTAVNNLTRRVKRTAFGFRRFRHCQIRALLYTGKPNWALLNTINPHQYPKSRFAALKLNAVWDVIHAVSHPLSRLCSCSIR